MSYGYDAIGQLMQVDAARPSDAARYAYDATDNPIRRVNKGDRLLAGDKRARES